MKGKWLWFLGFALCGILGWSLGYLRVPYIESNHSFWVGFGFCAALGAFLLLVMLMVRRTTLLTKAFG